MNPTQPTPSDELSRLEGCLDEFDAAWGEEDPPRLEDFLPPVETSLEGKRWYLAELVMMDLGQRWRRQLGQPRLEDYLAQFPELGANLPFELIAEEYRVRRLWGDRPEHTDYLQRFADRHVEVAEKLAAVDAELAAELAARREQRIITKREVNVPVFHDDELGKESLGPYVLLEPLGEGGLGQVFRARHRESGQIVALKTIRAELLTEPEVVQRFYREVRLLERLDHAHLVRALDAGEAHGRHYLAMEFVNGIDLSRLVKEEGPLSPELACTAIVQAARGLAYAHEQGLVHRDIKPSNLMLTYGTQASDRPTVKILDLGLARLHHSEDPVTGEPRGDMTSTLTPLGGVLVMGTPDYLAPEQAVNFHGVDVRADIYSLGCTLYFLLTGEPPFPGGTLAEKLWRHQQEEPPAVESFRSDIDPELTVILQRMLAKKPEDRFQTPAEVVTAFETLEGRSRLGRWLKRSRWLLPYAASGLAACLLIWAIVFGLSRDWNAASVEPLPAPFEAGLGHERFPWQPAELVAVLGEERQRHWGEVNAVVLAEKRNWIVSGGNDHVLRVWDATSMREWQVLGGPGTNGHGAGVLSLAFDREGRLLASGARDHTIRLWDFSGQAPRMVGGITSAHIGRIYALQFARHGRWLASCADDHAVRFWDMTGPEPRPKTAIEVPDERFFALAVSPDDRLLAAGGYLRKLRVWDVSGAQPVALATLDGHKGWIRALAFTPDNSFLVSGGEDDAVRVWSLDPEPREVNVLFHGEGVLSLRFAPDGKLLASGGKDGTIRLWNWPGHKAIQKVAFKAHNAGVTSLAFSADGRTLISAGNDGTVRRWDLRAQPPAETHPLDASACLLREAYFAPDGHTLAGITVDGQLRLWRLGTSARESRLDASPDPDERKLVGMGLALTDNRLAHSFTDRSIRLWDLTDKPRFLARWQAHERDLRA
ncbi:MAG: WD40 repeat domain-containing serine/threonine protein kinase, partial [Gemmataceae bacterium]